MSEPAPTLTGKSGTQWVLRNRRDSDAWVASTTTMADAIRITLQEALTLQSFDPGYPVQGNKTKQFEQVGNAVPPKLAAAVIEALVGREWVKQPPTDRTHSDTATIRATSHVAERALWPDAPAD